MYEEADADVLQHILLLPYNMLMICSLLGQAEGVERLIKTFFFYERRVSMQNFKGETAFSLAVDRKHWEVMAILAKHNANTDYLCSPDRIPNNISETELSVNQNKPYNILMICSLSGHIEGVKKLLESSSVKAHINAQNPGDETAFYLALAAADTFREMDKFWSVVRMLLSAGADPGLLPEQQFEKFQQIIASSGCNNEDETLLIYFSSRKNQLDVTKKLLRIPAVRDSINVRHTIGPDFPFLPKKETTAFFQAVDSGKLQIMDLLLKAGADPTIPDGDGNTPLMGALSGFVSYSDSSLIKGEERKQKADIVKRLLSLDAVKDPAHLNAENREGETALSFIEGLLEKEPDAPLFLEIRKELLENGALPPQGTSGKKAGKRKSLQAKEVDRNVPITEKNQKQNQPFRETAQEEKKRLLQTVLFGRIFYPI